MNRTAAAVSLYYLRIFGSGRTYDGRRQPGRGWRVGLRPTNVPFLRNNSECAEITLNSGVNVADDKIIFSTAASPASVFFAPNLDMTNDLYGKLQ